MGYLFEKTWNFASGNEDCMYLVLDSEGGFITMTKPFEYSIKELSLSTATYSDIKGSRRPKLKKGSPIININAKDIAEKKYVLTIITPEFHRYYHYNRLVQERINVKKINMLRNFGKVTVTHQAKNFNNTYVILDKKYDRMLLKNEKTKKEVSMWFNRIETGYKFIFHNFPHKYNYELYCERKGNTYGKIVEKKVFWESEKEKKIAEICNFCIDSNKTKEDVVTYIDNLTREELKETMKKMALTWYHK